MDKGPAPDRDALVPVTSLEEFFRDSIDAALATNHVVVDGETSRYVLQLLTLFARADACLDAGDGSPRHRPLALILADAAQATSREERACILQRLGDVSLFTAGFDEIEREHNGVKWKVCPAPLSIDIKEPGPHESSGSQGEVPLQDPDWNDSQN